MQVERQAGHPPPETAIACGLILNELLTNAFKYAYPAEASGRNLCFLARTGSRICEAYRCHKGVGFPLGFDSKNAQSLGMTIVEALTQQLGGEPVVGAGPGASFTVQFSKSA